MDPKSLTDTIVSMINAPGEFDAYANKTLRTTIKDSKGLLYFVHIIWSEDYQVLGAESPLGESPKLADMEFCELHRCFLQFLVDPPRELKKKVKRVILSSRNLTVEKFYESGWRLNSELDLELN